MNYFMKILLPASIKLLSILLAFIFISCSVDEDKLHRYAGENDSESIIEFMEDKDNRDYSLKLKAIDIIVKNKLKDGLKYLEVLFYEHDEVKFKMKIVQAFHKYNINFRDSRKLYNYYMDINSGWESPYLKDDVKAILYNSFDSELANYSDSLLQSSLYSGNYPSGYKILKVRSEFIAPDSVILNIQPILELIVTDPNSFSSAKSINAQIQSLQAARNKLDADYNDIVAKLDKETNNLNSLKEDLDKIEYYWINGIVVAEYSTRVYEVNIYGADTRAILNTNNTLFQTKGYFEMRVKKTGNYPMKIKDQYGGFTQVWPIYEELTSKDENEFNSLKLKIQNKEEEIRDIKKISDATFYSNRRQQITSKLSNFEKSKIDLLSKVETQQKEAKEKIKTLLAVQSLESRDLVFEKASTNKNNVSLEVAQTAIFDHTPDITEIMYYLYKSYNEFNGISEWVFGSISKENEIIEFVGGGSFSKSNRKILTSLVIDKTLKINNVMKRIIITSSNIENHNCHSCGVFLGGFVLTQNNAGWVFDLEDYFFTETSSFGKAPRIFIEKIGDNEIGIVAEPSYIYQGLFFTNYNLFTIIDNKIKPVFETTKAEAYEPDWGWSSNISFVKNGSNRYYDINIKRAGTEESKDETINQINEQNKFSFNGNKYDEIK